MRLFRRGKRRTFWVEYRDPVSGREVRQSLRVTSGRVAKVLGREKEEQIARRHHRLAERKPWEEAVKAYLAHGKVHKEPVTVAEDRRTLEKRFPPCIAAVVHHVDEVRPDHLEAYVAGRKALGLSPFRVNRELRTLRAFFNWCGIPSRRWIQENPAREVPMLREPRGLNARALADADLERLVRAVAGTRLEGPVLLAANHGLRVGELVHLRRDGVDLARGTLWIRHDPLTGWKVKGGQERIVHLNAATGPWLASYLADPARDLSPYLFAVDFGRPWSREALVVAMGRAMRGVGIARGGFHMLRHTWATRQAEAGTPLPVIKAMGGWRDWRSMAAYQHIADQAQRDAAARVIIGPRPARVVPLRRRGRRP